MEQHQTSTAPTNLDDAAVTTVAALADNVTGIIGIARALAMCDRPVDLSGLNAMAGLLCAKALDLPPDRGRLLRPKLALLRNDLDALSAALRAREPA